MRGQTSELEAPYLVHWPKRGTEIARYTGVLRRLAWPVNPSRVHVVFVTADLPRHQSMTVPRTCPWPQPAWRFCCVLGEQRRARHHPAGGPAQRRGRSARSAEPRDAAQIFAPRSLNQNSRWTASSHRTIRFVIECASVACVASCALSTRRTSPSSSRSGANQLGHSRSRKEVVQRRGKTLVDLPGDPAKVCCRLRQNLAAFAPLEGPISAKLCSRRQSAV
jgi:hypothetical protein